SGRNFKSLATLAASRPHKYHPPPPSAASSSTAAAAINGSRFFQELVLRPTASIGINVTSTSATGGAAPATRAPGTSSATAGGGSGGGPGRAGTTLTGIGDGVRDGSAARLASATQGPSFSDTRSVSAIRP